MRVVANAILAQMTRAVGEGPIDAVEILALRNRAEGAKQFWAAVEAAVHGGEEDGRASQRAAGVTGR